MQWDRNVVGVTLFLEDGFCDDLVLVLRRIVFDVLLQPFDVFVTFDLVVELVEVSAFVGLFFVVEAVEHDLVVRQVEVHILVLRDFLDRERIRSQMLLVSLLDRLEADEPRLGSRLVLGIATNAGCSRLVDVVFGSERIVKKRIGLALIHVLFVVCGQVKIRKNCLGLFLPFLVQVLGLEGNKAFSAVVGGILSCFIKETHANIKCNIYGERRVSHIVYDISSVFILSVNCCP